MVAMENMIGGLDSAYEGQPPQGYAVTPQSSLDPAQPTRVSGNSQVGTPNANGAIPATEVSIQSNQLPVKAIDQKEDAGFSGREAAMIFFGLIGRPGAANIMRAIEIDAVNDAAREFKKNKDKFHSNVSIGLETGRQYVAMTPEQKDSPAGKRLFKLLVTSTKNASNLYPNGESLEDLRIDDNGDVYAKLNTVDGKSGEVLVDGPMISRMLTRFAAFDRNPAEFSDDIAKGAAATLYKNAELADKTGWLSEDGKTVTFSQVDPSTGQRNDKTADANVFKENYPILFRKFKEDAADSKRAEDKYDLDIKRTKGLMRKTEASIALSNKKRAAIDEAGKVTKNVEVDGILITRADAYKRFNMLKSSIFKRAPKALTGVDAVIAAVESGNEPNKEVVTSLISQAREMQKTGTPKQQADARDFEELFNAILGRESEDDVTRLMNRELGQEKPRDTALPRN